MIDKEPKGAAKRKMLAFSLGLKGKFIRKKEKKNSSFFYMLTCMYIENMEEFIFPSQGRSSANCRP
jgi:hypothetical protein